MKPQTFSPGEDRVCLNCGRTIAWHAGHRCFPADARGMPPPDETRKQVQLELGAVGHTAVTGSAQRKSSEAEGRGCNPPQAVPVRPPTIEAGR